MNAVSVQQGRTKALSTPEAQAEVFWLAFQALPEDAQVVIRQRLLVGSEMSPDLAIELQSWQAAAAEALMDFETSIYEV